MSLLLRCCFLQDKVGNACDDDIDGDSIYNVEDNCPLVSNLDQSDYDNDGVGDACHEDCDGDGFKNQEDVCPCNSGIAKTDFRLPKKVLSLISSLLSIVKLKLKSEVPKSKVKILRTWAE